MGNRIDAELFDALVHTSGLAADIAASDKFKEKVPVAQQVAAGVEAAFAHAVGLGLVTVTPLEHWPHLRRIQWSRTEVIVVRTDG